MVDFIQLPQSARGRLAETLGQSIGGLGANQLQNYRASQAMGGLENDPEYQKMPASARLSRLQEALRPLGQYGQQIYQQRAPIEQMRAQEREQGILAKAMQGQPVTADEFGQISPESQLKYLQINKDRENKDKLKNLLIKRDMDPDEAELWANSTAGGQTELMKHMLEMQERGLTDEEGPFAPKSKTALQESDEEESGFKWPQIQKEKGRKPAETYRREDKREQTNIPIYNEANAALQSLKKEGLSLSRLDQLNKTDKLPSGVGRWNVDYEKGEVKVPALATDETQLFAKTVNDFTTQAKDSYGARVTNFELDRFLKRLPTLANTTGGRDLILSQMKIINELNQLEAESLKATYDHYGVGKINAQEARQYADKYKKEKEKDLLERYKTLDGKLKESNELTEDIALDYLKKANGDRKSAEEMARKDGYKF